jgi:uncharacterized membrane protein
MTDGIRSMLNWAAAVGGLLGAVILVVSFVVSLMKRRVRETTAPRALAIAILFIAIAAVAWGTAAIWPHPVE